MELCIQDLCVNFSTPSGTIPAVNHVSLTVSSQQVTGIIGETGSGKSVLGLSILGLLQSNAAVSGRILLDGRKAGSTPWSCWSSWPFPSRSGWPAPIPLSCPAACASGLSPPLP